MNTSLFSCGQAVLIVKLKNKFKNKRRISLSPTVVNKKRISVERKTNELRVTGVKNYHPKAGMTSLEAEKKRNAIISSGDAEQRKQLLAETLPERRKAIIDEKKSISKLRKMFPYMFGCDEVSVYEGL